MGNSIKTCYTPSDLDGAHENWGSAADRTAGGYEADVDDCGLQKGTPALASRGGKGRLKVKVVLTKGELEWLMLRLKEGEGGRVVDGAELEQALEEIQKGRKRDIGREKKSGRPWRPSLERITECPECAQTLSDDQLDGR